jgi:hypothetical protein
VVLVAVTVVEPVPMLVPWVHHLEFHLGLLLVSCSNSKELSTDGPGTLNSVVTVKLQKAGLDSSDPNR